MSARPIQDVPFSLEFFPPKTPDMEAKLWDSVKRLEPLSPSYVSVTYGAGGSTREPGLAWWATRRQPLAVCR